MIKNIASYARSMGTTKQKSFKTNVLKLFQFIQLFS